MRPIIQIAALLVFALLLGFPATDASAQRATESAKKAVVAPAWASLAGLPLDAIVHIEKGDQLVAERKFGRARNEYKAAAELLEAEGDFPVVPLRRIAESYYFEGRYQTAVYSLDRLAENAARQGDAVTQAWALADAAWVLGQDCKQRFRGGAKMELDSRVHQLRDVLSSPYLPDEVRNEISAKRCDGCHATAPNKTPEMTCYRPGTF